LVEILVKQIDKDPTNIPFEVVCPVVTVPVITALADVGLAAALESLDVPAVEWEEDKAPFYMGVSWEPTHAVALCVMEEDHPSSF
jgi:hypothetical protein